MKALPVAMLTGCTLRGVQPGSTRVRVYFAEEVAFDGLPVRPGGGSQ